MGFLHDLFPFLTYPSGSWVRLLWAMSGNPQLSKTGLRIQFLSGKVQQGTRWRVAKNERGVHSGRTTALAVRLFHLGANPERASRCTFSAFFGILRLGRVASGSLLGPLCTRFVSSECTQNTLPAAPFSILEQVRANFQLTSGAPTHRRSSGSVQTALPQIMPAAAAFCQMARLLNWIPDAVGCLWGDPQIHCA